jgi:metal-sulfur cluster biosynthetic enzyme
MLLDDGSSILRRFGRKASSFFPRRGGNTFQEEKAAMGNQDILQALKNVMDPELGINVVDLGLVCRAAHVSDGIEVSLSMTSPACPLGELMVEDARLALQQSFPNVTTIQVDLIRDQPWSPERMTEDGRRQLGLS